MFGLTCFAKRIEFLASGAEFGFEELEVLGKGKGSKQRDLL